MTVDDPHAAGEALQFDRVVSNSPGASPGASERTVICKSCSSAISGEYYHVNGKVTCESCRRAIEKVIATPDGASPAVRAFGLGLLAAIAGAAIYYGVIEFAHLEIGLIAIAIGYMVGWGVHKGAGGGGRGYQVLAAVLTYWSVGLAYAPFFLRDSSMPLPTQFFYIFSLPVIIITRSASGIITAIIVGVGMRQAWRMTAAPSVTINGPYRVGSGPSAANV